MKFCMYIQVLMLIFINNLLLAVSLGGTVILDSSDKNFNFNGKTLIIEDTGNTFGSVNVTSAGSFVFPKTVSDNKNHVYSLKLIQIPNNNGYVCTINQASGTVFLHDKTDLVVSCKGKYYISVNVIGLSNGDTYSISNNYQTLSFSAANSNITQTFIQWYYASFNYYLNPIFNYTSLNYKRCSKYYSNNDIITNNVNININCYTSNFNKLNYQPSGRYGVVSWKDNLGNAYIFGGCNAYYFILNYYNDLWKFNGTTWTQVIANGITGSPSPRQGAVVWTDSSGNAYVFGGEDYLNKYNDLWKFDGVNWTQINNVGTPPSPREGSVSWTDSVGNHYLFGGLTDAFVPLNDLWRFDGVSWTQITNVGTPPRARSYAVSWTDNSGNVYVFGGFSLSIPNYYYNDLWKFDGVSWTQITNVGTTPSARVSSVSWTDNSGNAYVFGGYIRSSYVNDLWMFNGHIWTQITNVGTPPSARSNAVSWTDNSGNAYVFGGVDRVTNYNDLSKFNGTTWTPVFANGGLNTAAPSARYGSVSWTDSLGKVYVFGGWNGSSYTNDLWMFNGSIWTQKIANGQLDSPSARYGAVSWKDSLGNAYIFGGCNGSTFYNDLWLYNGTTWRLIFDNGVSTSPNRRMGSVSWTDNLGNAYIFGGFDNNSYYNDVWKFDGINWNHLTIVGMLPSARESAVSWTDNLGNAYVFGGKNGIIYSNDLWRFNGTTWTQVISNEVSGSPSARSGALSWTDSVGNAYVLGGYNGSTTYNDLWKFNGLTWSQVTLEIGDLPSARYGAVSWTDSTGKVYVFAGTDGTNSYNDLFAI